MRSEWNFDETIRGTLRGVPVQLNLADEWDLEEEGDGSAWGEDARHRSVLEGTTLSNVSVLVDRQADIRPPSYPYRCWSGPRTTRPLLGPHRKPLRAK